MRSRQNKVMVMIRLASIAIWISLLALKPLWAQTLTGSVRGRVVDLDFESPVAGADVQLLEINRRVQTDADGFYLIAEVAPGSYTLVITRDGYERLILPGVAVIGGGLAEADAMLRGEFSELEEVVVRDVAGSSDAGTEAGILSLRAESLSLQDSVSRELMGRAGASDAASAVKLVVGTTIVDGKYASVRGLSDRYVGTSVNGFRVPSSDPKKRAVQLDIFPAGTIENISVSKTFTPDLPGDYSGGGVAIRLSSIPAEPFFKLGFSRSFNRTYHGSDQFVTYNGGGVDAWARQRGERDLLEEAETMEEDGLSSAGLTSEHETPVDATHPHDPDYRAYDRITRSFQPAMGTTRTRIPEDYSVNLSMGGRQPMLGDAALGAILALDYKRAHTIIKSEDATYERPSIADPQVTNVYNWAREEGSAEVKYGMLGSFGIENGEDQSISLTLMRARSGTDRASLRIEEHDPADPAYWEQRQAIQYAERSLDSFQLQGRHNADDLIKPGLGLRLDWFGGYNMARQYEPDVRYFENVVIPVPAAGYYIYQQQAPGSSGAASDKSTRIWRDTKEDNAQYGMNVTVPFDREFEPQDESATESGLIKFGWLTDLTRRVYEQKSFYYNFATQLPPTFTGPVRSDFPPGRAGTQQYLDALNLWRASPAGIAYSNLVAATSRDSNIFSYTNTSPDVLWTDVFTNPDRIGSGDYQNSMRWYITPKVYDVSYTADQELPGGYMMFDLPLTRRINFMLGGRFENTAMSANPQSDMQTIDPARAFQVAVQNEAPQPDGTTNYYYTIAGVPQEDAVVDLQESHFLRAAGLTYKFTDEMKLRYNYGQTIARPTFLELAPVITFDYIDNVAYVGNNELEISEVENHDIRWEWFPAAGRVLSASFFTKDIEQPIDKESFSYLSQDYIIAVNYPEGQVRGYELEWKTDLGSLPHFPGRFSMGANYTRILAKVEVPENIRTELERHTIGQEKRDMEGQPAYIANLNLSWENDSGTTFSWFFNRAGDLLKTGAAIGEEGATPNVYKLARESVDVSLSQKVGSAFTLTFRIKNITDQMHEEVYRIPDDTDITRRTYKEGVQYSFSFGGSF